jgi:hypothetical protein
MGYRVGFRSSVAVAGYVQLSVLRAERSFKSLGRNVENIRFRGSTG